MSNTAGNTRNGFSRKKLNGEFGELPIEVLRDRHGTFNPQIVDKHQTRLTGFDDKILSLYARGTTVREIQAHLQEMHGAEVAPSLISSVTDAVADEVKTWQSRPLCPVYPIDYLDCIHTKVRDGAVRVKAADLALGINLAGVQLCIVHMVRHSLNYVSWKRRGEVAADLKRIYQSSTVDEVELRLGEFEAKWDDDYIADWSVLAVQLGATHAVFFEFPPEIRKVIYTTNASDIGEHKPAQNHQEPGIVPQR